MRRQRPSCLGTKPAPMFIGMKNSRWLNVLFALILIMSSFACNPPSNDHSRVNDHLAVPSSADTNNTAVPVVFYYEPCESKLTGTLRKERFYGAPGFGEDTLHDAIENCFILELAQPIGVNSCPDSAENNSYNSPLKNISRLQLVSLNGKQFEKWIGHNITVQGKLFGAFTGHHHTDVLLDDARLDP